jgi:ABC-type dipeptide/oligopeptide/nickel transport system permease subunit
MATALAATVGAFAGYFGGVVNTALLTLIDLLMVLPAFLIIAILSPSFRGHTWLVFVVLLAVDFPGFGVKPAEALSLSLLGYTLNLAWSAIGGLVYLTVRKYIPPES